MTTFFTNSRQNDPAYGASQVRLGHRRFDLPDCQPLSRMRAGLACLLCIACGVAQAGLVTPDQKNLNALTEAMITSEIQISQKLGFVPHQTLHFEGDFSTTGWLATLSGTYAGTPVNLSFAGSFDAAGNLGSFTSTGLLGSTAWAGNGSIRFTDTTPNDYAIDWVSQAFLAGEEFDAEVKKVYNYKEKDGIVTYTDTGTIQKTKNGIPVGEPLKEDPSKGTFPKPPEKGKGVYTIQVEDLYALDSTFNLRKEGEIEGIVTTVPEPASWLMLSAGVLSLMIYSRKRPQKG